eukprot:2231851-Rhodomonas_salina.4
MTKAGMRDTFQMFMSVLVQSKRTRYNRVSTSHALRRTTSTTTPFCTATARLVVLHVPRCTALQGAESVPGYYDLGREAVARDAVDQVRVAHWHAGREARADLAVHKRTQYRTSGMDIMHVGTGHLVASV